ncbi:hypothetical protein LTS18_012152, partial [Coniosporium uncinatum]
PKTAPTPSKPAPVSTKRQHPGKLDIGAATVSPPEQAKSEVVKPTAVPLSVGSRPVTPAAVATPSPIKRAPTLRLVNTPKTDTEAPPPLPTPSAAQAIAQHALGDSKAPSRKGSVTSINLPGTPASELRDSDNISMTTSSLSRANSPPPGVSSRVGSAPVKASKNLKKKQRAEAKKEIEEDAVLAMEGPEKKAEKPAAPAPEVGPIIARKKKSKKPDVGVPKNKASTTTTPAVTRPGSPEPKEDSQRPKVEEPKPVTELMARSSKPELPADTPEPAPEPESLPSSPPPKPVTPANIITSLLADHASLKKSIDHLLKPQVAFHYRHDLTPADLPNHIFQSSFTPSEQQWETLQRRQPLRFDAGNNRLSGRGLVTPKGTKLRGLSKEEEDLYLEVESRLASEKAFAKWYGSSATIVADGMGKENGSGGGVDVRALLGSFAAADAAAVQAARRRGERRGGVRDEALEHVNQFVLPRVDGPRSLGVGAAVAGGVDVGIAPQPAAVAAGVGQGPGSMGGMERSLSAEQAERAMLRERKVVEGLEKRLLGLVKRNRKAVG